jgi:diadenosine tetraphosphate (Ap4A) HIT family hydrolase
MDRKRAAMLAYDKHLRERDPNTNCDFCNTADAGINVVAEYTHCYVMANTFPYTQWELREVVEHLLIVPRRHVTSLSKLSSEESKELVTLLGKYEQDGYDIFARSPSSTTRTLIHQHTHLIKSRDKRARGVVFWRKPYILKLFR